MVSATGNAQLERMSRLIVRSFTISLDGYGAGLNQPKDAPPAPAAGDIRLLGGASTIRQYLQASLVDEMHIAVSSRLLGAGEPLFTGLDLRRLGDRSVTCTPGEKAVHYVIGRGQRA